MTPHHHREDTRSRPASGASIALVPDGPRTRTLGPQALAAPASRAAVRRFLDDYGLDLARMHAALLDQPVGREIDPGFTARLIRVLTGIGVGGAGLGLPRLELAASDAERLTRRLRASRSTLSTATVTILGELLGSLDDQLMVIGHTGGERFLDADTSLRHAARTRSRPQVSRVVA